MKQTLVQKFALVELISIKWTFAYSKIRLMHIFPSPKNRKPNVSTLCIWSTRFLHYFLFNFDTWGIAYKYLVKCWWTKTRMLLQKMFHLIVQVSSSRGW